VIVAAPSADRELAQSCVQRLARAHRQVKSAAFAPVREVGEVDGLAFVAFECDGVSDGEDALGLMAAARERVTYPEAMAIVARLGTAIEVAHGHVDSQTKAPLAFGGLAWANVIVARDGQLHLFGLGHNVVVRDEHGALCATPSFFGAPEIAVGGPPTCSSDSYAFVHFQRSMVSHCELPASLTRIFAGNPTEADVEIGSIFRFASERVLNAQPLERSSMTELRQMWEREWRLLGLTPDPTSLGARLRALFAPERRTGSSGSHPALSTQAAGVLEIGAEGAWFSMAGGSPRRLDGRLALKRILMRLAEEWSSSPGGRVDADSLFETGWPGEQPFREAAMNRLHVAIATLRKMGLRDALQRDAGGYRIDPAVRVVIVDEQSRKV
jgi:hypothetical protein